jgi:hypothetical protein
MQHEGRLDFRPGDKGYDALLEASAHVPTIVVVDMNRPAILTNMREKASALLASFGVSDKALVKFADRAEFHHTLILPFELPSSMEEVRTSDEKISRTTRNILFIPTVMDYPFERRKPSLHGRSQSVQPASFKAGVRRVFPWNCTRTSERRFGH